MRAKKIATCKPVEITVGRDTGWIGNPCSGYATFRVKQPSGGEREPLAHDFIEEALGGLPEPGSVVRLTVTVELVKDAKPSQKRCHIPFHRRPSDHHGHEEHAAPAKKPAKKRGAP